MSELPDGRLAAINAELIKEMGQLALCSRCGIPAPVASMDRLEVLQKWLCGRCLGFSARGIADEVISLRAELADLKAGK